MNEMELRRFLTAGETAVSEYKTGRGPLSDNDLVETVVCLANYRGETLLLGVEDDEMIEQQAGDTLDRLAEAGLVLMEDGVYPLNPDLQEPGAQPAGTAETAAEAILGYVAEHGRITRREAAHLTDMTEEQAKYRLSQMVIEGYLTLVGWGRGAYYERLDPGKNRNKWGIPHLFLFSADRPVHPCCPDATGGVQDLVEAKAILACEKGFLS